MAAAVARQEHDRTPSMSPKRSASEGSPQGLSIRRSTAFEPGNVVDAGSADDAEDGLVMARNGDRFVNIWEHAPSP